MRTLAVIPARLGASRLPRKPLQLLAGLPLVVRVWQRVTEMELVERCVIATDSDEVAKAARPHGAEVVLTSSSHPSGTDRIAEVVARPEYRSFDAIVNVQGDEPFVAESAVRGAMDQVGSARYPLGTAAARATEGILGEPSVVKVVSTRAGGASFRHAHPNTLMPDNATIRSTPIVR